ncbi:MAG: LysR family transcriptional regulator [Sphingomonadales bacterium]
MALPDFEAWAIFAAVAEHGSFGGAARALGLSNATVSKAVARLEVSMGTTLFNRTSRRIALTETGASLAERAARLLSDAIETEECAREEVGAPRGTVKLAVPMSFGLAEIGPVVAGFMAAYPDITVELNLSDSLVDIVGDGYDVALRIAAMPDSSLRARKLRDVRLYVVASPGWISRHGDPVSPAALDAGHVFGYTMVARQTLAFHHSDGREAMLRTEGRLRTNNGDAMIAALEAGLGIAMLPDFIAAPSLKSGRLVPILADWSMAPIALHLVTPPGKLRPRRVTALIDFLSERMRPLPDYA